MSDKDDPSIPEAILTILVALASIPVRAFALCKLWLWFIVPQFGFKPLTMPIAYGLCVFIGLLLLGFSAEDSKDRSALMKAMAYLIAPLLSLGLGYVATLFM